MSGTVLLCLAVASEGVGDDEFLSGIAGEYARAVRSDDDLLLDAGSREPIVGRAIGLEGEHHSLSELDRFAHAVEAGGGGPLLQGHPPARPELRPQSDTLRCERDTCSR